LVLGLNIVFLGPPGSGKGTQAKGIAEKFGLTHLSTGDAFRDAISKKTELGLEIQAYVDGGKLVPDELVSKVVFEKIASLKTGFLLDGYPRTVDQAKSLETFGKKNNVAIDAVIFFEVAFEELVKRLSARRQCPKCKEVYNLANKPPRKEDTCDKCGTTLNHRPDDQPNIVEERLKVYTRQTEPVLDFYKQHPRFKKIDAAQPINNVAIDIQAALKS
jgi:adenylate kinase